MRETAAAVVIGCALNCASAFAQEAATDAAPLPTIPVPQKPAAAPADLPKGDAAQLEDIVVTATKREKSLREIPASIDEFNGAQLEAQGKWGIQDYIQDKPGVTMTSIAPNLNKISLRGIATDAYPGSPLSSGTGIFIGDTTFGDPFITNIQPDFAAFDLASVEILKGPQGTLFGGAALSGAIRYVMQAPVLGEWQARAFGQYDAPAHGSAVFSEGAVFNAPLGDTFAARLGYIKHDYPGITDNVLTGAKDVDYTTGNQYRGLATWQPWDALSIKATYLKQDSKTPFANPLADSPRGPRQTSLKILPQPSNTDFGLYSVEASYDFGPVRATALASHTFKNWYLLADATAAITGPPDENTNPETGSFQITNDNSKANSQEVRLQSTGNDGLQWVAGVFNVNYKVFFDILVDTIANRDLNRTLGTPQDLYYETTLIYAVTNVRAYERAAFLDVGYKFWNRLELSAGARYYKTEVAGGFKGTGITPRSQNMGQNFNYSDHVISEDGVSPKATATFDFTRDISAYASASRGFRFGGLQSVPSNSVNGVPPAYESDTLWNYEFGTRTAWFDNTLHFDTTLFYIDYNNPQVALRTTTPGPALSYIDNVGHAISRGLESSLVWLTPLDGVRLELAGGLTDAHTTVPFDAPNINGGVITIPAGAPMPGSARSQYSAAINYLTPRLGVFDIGAHVSYRYIGKGYADLAKGHAVNDYGTLNAGLTFTVAAWRLKPQLALNVSNITDETASILGLYVKPVVGDIYELFYLNPPRTLSARLSLEF